MTNFEKLDEVITYAAAHPDEFDMGSWISIESCGTTACLAGTAALLAGGRPAVDGEFLGGDWDTVVMPGSPEPVDVEELACEIFGFTPGNGQSVVFYTSDLAAVIEYRNLWAEAEGVPQREWEGVVLPEFERF